MRHHFYKPKAQKKNLHVGQFLLEVIDFAHEFVLFVHLLLVRQHLLTQQLLLVSILLARSEGLVAFAFVSAN